MSSVAIGGFFIGTIAYFIFDWLTANSTIYIVSFPISQIIFSPGFISGIVGALIALIAVVVYAHFSSPE